jgi:glycosyltransferase involved in cell wall biosynthesis
MPETVPDLVSTIIPVHNRPGMLRQAVESVLAQTWRPIEIIVSDDGSTDETAALGRQFAAQHPDTIRYIWNSNRGPGPAREAGRQLARGEFIQYLDSDDLLWPRKFEIQVKALRAHPECGAAYGWIRLCPEGAPPGSKPYKWSGQERDELFPALLVDCWWHTNAPLWRRTVSDAIGPWTDLRYSEDWEYFARAGALRVKLAYCPEFVTDQRHHQQKRESGTGRWLAPPDRVRFFGSLMQYGREAGVPIDSDEMRHFSRWAFSHARQCGLLGDADASRKCLEIALAASGVRSRDLRIYKGLAKALGWGAAARLASWLDRVRLKAAGRHTRRQSWMDS